MNASVHRADVRFLSLQQLCRLGNESMRQMMGIYSDGPFTPVQFFYSNRPGVTLCRGQRTMSRGTRVAFLSNTL